MGRFSGGLARGPVQHALPMAEYEFSTRLPGLRKTAAHYEGWYAPLRPGTWNLRLRLPKAAAQRFKTLELNEKKQEITPGPEGGFEFRGRAPPESGCAGSWRKGG